MKNIFENSTGVSVTSNTLSMAALSLSRYIFVHNSLFRNNISLLKWLLLSLVWLISITITIPILFVRKEEGFKIASNQYNFCIEGWKSKVNRKIFSTTIFVFIYLLPCLTLIYCQLSINLALKSWNKSKKVDHFARNSARKRAFRVKASESSMGTSNSVCGNQSSSSDYRAQKEHLENISKERRIHKNHENLARLLMGLILCFMFCWLPYNLMSFFIDITDSVTAIKLLPYTLLLGHAHSAINPIVYWRLNMRKYSVKRECIKLRSMLVRKSQSSVNKDSVIENNVKSEHFESSFRTSSNFRFNSRF